MPINTTGQPAKTQKTFSIGNWFSWFLFITSVWFGVCLTGVGLIVIYVIAASLAELANVPLGIAFLIGFFSPPALTSIYFSLKY